MMCIFIYIHIQYYIYTYIHACTDKSDVSRWIPWDRIQIMEMEILAGLRDISISARCLQRPFGSQSWLAEKSINGGLDRKIMFR